ncbi:uncharacterized protein ARMOST_07691 [Armillaria ostoyae]|uniref:Uncharacterized protein n=1 Tax=Armillaria ostoyae TaxID=47428 RepID=A0A284R6H6_ARMOS|nr:uncharacterized protein ARMOST_07691 [Armillaria ostoyae]
MSLLFPLQCWMLFSLLLPTAMAYIIHLENNCGSGSPSVIREDGTRVDGVNSYESSGIVSVLLDQGSCGPLGESCSTIRVNESGWAVGSPSAFSVPITLLYSGNPLVRRSMCSSEIPTTGLSPGLRDVVDPNCHRINLWVIRGLTSPHNDLHVAEQDPPTPDND